MPSTAATRNDRGAVERASIALAAPVFNEVAVIATSVVAWADHLEQAPWVDCWEIVVCDDGSTDGTAAVLADLVGRIPQLRVVSFPQNRGASEAIAAAISATTMPWVLVTDSDGQFAIEGADRLWDAVSRSGKRAATGVRSHKADDLGLRFGSWISGVVANVLIGSRYRDFNSIFKLVEGELLRSIPLESTGLNCSTELTAQVHERGVTWVEVTIDHRPRADGQRSWHLWEGARRRALYVGYLGLRHRLLRFGVLREPVRVQDVDRSVA